MNPIDELPSDYLLSGEPLAWEAILAGLCDVESHTTICGSLIVTGKTQDRFGRTISIQAEVSA